ncbi:DUF2938 domain-containing protein [Gluconobacter thailandicus]|uniref:DUF2938 domain-containing protein n=1 Tax=Gluconobacter thailandicus TaxID=257438 RepID=A0AAP9EW80_GLUTH|nr:DUF2938 domain-containing protein [Gluconobacter thailandicus]QEH97897.1 DUF2938 domain-containing protein [Gluconobacter thailandicus]
MDFGELGLRVVFVGAGATAVMDLWALTQKRLLGIPSLDYAMVGRWIAGLKEGKVAHDTIGRSPPVVGEKAIGWAAHYLVGIVFAGLLVALAGKDWLSAPMPGIAILVGLMTVAAPFLILQPGMGAGVAASRTPKPAVARTRSVIAHLSFGIGLYLAGLISTILPPL